MAKNQAGAQVPGAGEVSVNKRKMGILLGVGALALLLSLGGLTYALLSGGDNGNAGSAAAEVPEPVRLPALYEPLEPAFTVNYAHAGRQRYMQVNVVLMGRDPQAMAAVKEHAPLIRNQLVMLFSGADFEQLMSAEGKEQLRAQATLTVQGLLEQELGAPTIESVLFTNLVMQ